jgi:hypothetical protein
VGRWRETDPNVPHSACPYLHPLAPGFTPICGAALIDPVRQSAPSGMGSKGRSPSFRIFRGGGKPRRRRTDPNVPHSARPYHHPPPPGVPPLCGVALIDPVRQCAPSGVGSKGLRPLFRIFRRKREAAKARDGSERAPLGASVPAFAGSRRYANMRGSPHRPGTAERTVWSGVEGAQPLIQNFQGKEGSREGERRIRTSPNRRVRARTCRLPAKCPYAG